MSDSTIHIIQGADFNLQLTFTNPDGSSYNLTGATVKLYVCRSPSATLAIPMSATGSNNLLVVNLKFSGSTPSAVTVTDNLGNTYALAVGRSRCAAPST